jgi:hypothetical protein
VLFRKCEPNGFSAESLYPLCYSPEGDWLFSWADDQPAEVAWELKLQLRNGTNGTAENWGYFSLLRLQQGDPLLLDMNLLSEEFLKSLSAAVQRASEHLHAQHAEAVAAGAGGNFRRTSQH